MYGDLLRMAYLLEPDIRILELRINESLWRTKRWLDSRCLKMAPEKTETLLITDSRSFQYPKIALGEHEIEWKKSINYLGVQLDRSLSFGEHPCRSQLPKPSNVEPL